MSRLLDFQRSFPRWGRSGLMLGIMVGMVALFFASGLVGNANVAFAQSYCSSSSWEYDVVSGDTLSAIAARYHTNWQAVATHNHIANPDQISPGRKLCIPKKWSKAPSSNPQPINVPSDPNAARGQANIFPYGQCTWWADERYHQLTGIYVPWTTNSDAWKWTARAHEFHWHVSSQPSVGAIMDLQPWVQGAYGLGHVAVVEQILSNGHVIASSMNWGSNPSQVTNAEFTPGSGVTFITF